MKKTGGVGGRRMGAERLRRREGSTLNSNPISILSAEGCLIICALRNLVSTDIEIFKQFIK